MPHDATASTVADDVYALIELDPLDVVDAEDIDAVRAIVARMPAPPTSPVFEDNEAPVPTGCSRLAAWCGSDGFPSTGEPPVHHLAEILDPAAKQIHRFACSLSSLAA